MNWFRKLWGKPVAPSAPASGVLFGLDPPVGCHFEVTCHGGTSWHVRIMRGGKALAHECELIGHGKTDEEMIIAAAKQAILACQTAEARRHLEGCYPPKNTNNKSAD